MPLFFKRPKEQGASSKMRAATFNINTSSLDTPALTVEAPTPLSTRPSQSLPLSSSSPSNSLVSSQTGAPTSQLSTASVTTTSAPSADLNSSVSSKAKRRERRPVENGHESGSERSESQSYSGSFGSSVGAAGLKMASEQRNDEFHVMFRSVPEEDRLVDEYSCALQKEILVQGRLFISEGHICFNANIFGWVTTLVIGLQDIVNIEKKMTALVIPNAIQISTFHKKYTFASFLSRDSAYNCMVTVWRASQPHVMARVLSAVQNTSDIELGHHHQDRHNRSRKSRREYSDEEDESYDEELSEDQESYCSDDEEEEDEDEEDEEEDPSDDWNEDGEAHAEQLENPTPRINFQRRRSLPNVLSRTASGECFQSSNDMTVCGGSSGGAGVTTSGSDEDSLGSESNFKKWTKQALSNDSSLFKVFSGLKPASTGARRNSPVGSLVAATVLNAYPQGFQDRLDQGLDQEQVQEQDDHLKAEKAGRHRSISDTGGRAPAEGDSGTGGNSNLAGNRRRSQSDATRPFLREIASARQPPFSGNILEKASNHPPSISNTSAPSEGKSEESERLTGRALTMPVEKATSFETATPPKQRRPTVCQCENNNAHYTNKVLDEVFPVSVEEAWRLLFVGPFVKNIFINEEKSKEVEFGEWQVVNGTETRKVSHYKQLSNPIGPRGTRCFVTDEVVTKDFNQAVTVLSTATTPDVPSGNAFVTKTRTCIMWAGSGQSRVIVTTAVEFTKSSWLKGAIERGTADGQKTYYENLAKKMHEYIRQHPSEFEGAALKDKSRRPSRKEGEKKRQKGRKPKRTGDRAEKSATANLESRRQPNVEHSLVYRVGCAVKQAWAVVIHMRHYAQAFVWIALIFMVVADLLVFWQLRDLSQRLNSRAAPSVPHYTSSMSAKPVPTREEARLLGIEEQVVGLTRLVREAEVQMREVVAMVEEEMADVKRIYWMENQK
ncbi:uncharacterized protein VTP21DRAFT_3171 [Calcarisporiella thermophila]|uniref:uncharacterized protein n=1 Tax=Calcarisporiella thermophila TaxID=911321 RepID=UPI003743E6BB